MYIIVTVTKVYIYLCTYTHRLVIRICNESVFVSKKVQRICNEKICVAKKGNSLEKIPLFSPVTTIK